MNDVRSRAERALPRLNERLKQLCTVADRVTYRVKFAQTDHFLFMGLIFLGKQIEHAQAIELLGNHPDSELVARSMLEGMWQLKWASLDPEARPLRWRTYSIVLDWRELCDRDAAGIPVDDTTRVEIAQGISEHGGKFMTPRAIAARTDGAMLPADPYVGNWSGKQMRQIAEEIGDHALYKTPYSDFSERHHWDPAGLARGIQVKDGTIGYNAISPVSRAGALAVAFQSLYESARDRKSTRLNSSHG